MVRPFVGVRAVAGEREPAGIAGATVLPGYDVFAAVTQSAGRETAMWRAPDANGDFTVLKLQHPTLSEWRVIRSELLRTGLHDNNRDGRPGNTSTVCV